MWPSKTAIPALPAPAEEIARLEYLTREDDFRNAGRGDPPPHTLPAEKLREVCIGSITSNGRIFYTTNGTGLQASLVNGDEATQQKAPWQPE